MQSRNSIGIAALIAAAGLAIAPDARAQADSTLNWNNAGGGAASTTTNWSPNQMPAATDDLTFPLLGIYTITFSNLVPSARTHTYRQGAITLSLSSPHTVSTGITVADLSGDVTTVTLTTGTLNSTAAVVIGDASGSSGALNVNDDDADLILTTAAGDLTVGNGGAGGLHVTGGGLVRVADRFTAGANSTSSSDVTVSGFTLSPIASSFLDVLGTGAAAAIGAGGDTTFSVTGGGQAHFAGTLNIAQGSASTSVAEVNGVGLLNSTLTVGADLNIAGNQSAGAAAGNGTLTINPDGVVEVTGTTNVGNDPDGGTGALNVSGGTLTTRSLIVNDLNGVLNFTDGTITVGGGTFDPQGIALTLNGTGGGIPVLELTNGATTSLAGISFGLRVGTTGRGILRVADPGSLLTVASATIVGDSAGSGGELRVNAGSAAQLAALTVGNAGSGTLEVGAGGAATLNSGTTLLGASGLGLANILGTWNVSGNLFVGGTSGAAGGTGTLTITSPLGLAHITGNSTVWEGGGSVEVVSGTMTVDGVLIIRGLATLNNGTINSANLIRLTGGSLTGHGTVNGGVLAVNGATITASGGPLTMGNASATGNVDVGAASSLNVGAETVTLLGTNSAPTHTLTIAGGVLDAASGITLVSGAAASGNGLIDAPVTLNGGSITASGGVLRFGGVVTRSSGTMSGTIFGFNSGGGYTGDGTIGGTAVDFDAGSTCTNTGILIMGNAANTSGVTMDGTLHCGNGTVTLLDANVVGLGTLTDLNGGNLVCAHNLDVGLGKTIEGTGFVQTPLLTVLGTTKPGDLPATGADRGDLHVSGAVTLTGGHTYFCDIDPGVEFAASDRILSTGAAAIGGALNVAFIHGYTPVASHTFDIVIGSSRTGVFSSVSIPPVGPAGPGHVEYFPDRARLVLCYANCDGSVVSPSLNVLDFSCFLNKFAAGDAFANCDGSTTPPVLNVLDFACFLNKFAAGCP